MDFRGCGPDDSHQFLVSEVELSSEYTVHYDNVDIVLFGQALQTLLMYNFLLIWCDASTDINQAETCSGQLQA